MERLVARSPSIMVVVMVVVMMMVMAEVPPERTNDDVVMMMVMVAIEHLRHLHFIAGFLGLLRRLHLIRLEGRYRVRHRIEQIPVARRFGRLRLRWRRGLSGGDGRQGGSCTEKTRDSLVHVSSERVWTFPNLPPRTIVGNRQMFQAGTEIGV